MRDSAGADVLRPAWLRVDRLVGEHGSQRDAPESRQEFERHMERRRLEEVDPEAVEEFRNLVTIW